MANPNIVNVTSIVGGNLGFNLSNTLTLPAAVGSASQALVTTDGAGTLGFTSTSTFGISTGKAIAMAIVFG